MSAPERFVRGYIGFAAGAFLAGSLGQTFAQAATENGWFTVVVLAAGILAGLVVSR